MPNYHGTILYYAPAPHQGDGKLTVLCVRLGLRLRRVKPEELEQTVGCLAGLDRGQEAPGAEGAQPVGEPMLVLCGLDERSMDALLRGLRQPGLPRIALKAVLTPTNRGWTMRALYEELCAERAGIAGHQEEGQDGPASEPQV
jgi:hypothetical protein